MINVGAIDLQLSDTAMRELTEGRSGPVVRALVRGGDRVAGYARVDLAAKRIGRNGDLSQQIDNVVSVTGGRVTVDVVSRARNDKGVPYGIFVHNGTDGPIVPRRARMLRFQGRGGAFVFARQVRGTKQTGRFTPFLKNGLDRLRTSDLL